MPTSTQRDAPVFFENLWRICWCPWGDVGIAPYALVSEISVWANAHVGPAEQSDNTVIPGDFVRTQWGDVLNRPLRNF